MDRPDVQKSSSVDPTELDNYPIDYTIEEERVEDEEELLGIFTSYLKLDGYDLVLKAG